MSETGGISFAGLLFLLFLGLKLAGVIAWPWVWVFAPIWIPVLIVLVVILVALIVAWVGDRR
jgi:hypothetical protein